ncbi:MAG: siroheme synthase CysG [Pseudomonadota bacterium]
MDYLPIFARINKQAVLVVGGGAIALRKVRLLLEAGARITVLAPQLHKELKALDGQYIHCIEQTFGGQNLNAYRMIIAATADSQINKKIYQSAQEVGVWVNAVDDPDHGNFIIPAIVDRSPLLVAISSSGQAPVLARMWREKLEHWMPQSLRKLGHFSAQHRAQIKSMFSDVNRRRAFWEELLRGPIQGLLAKGLDQKAESQLEHMLHTRESSSIGEVTLVGAGPGDPELLTIKALQCLHRADVIVHDGLVSDEILALARRDAERISVVKKAKKRSISQSEINALLIKLAHQGLNVCRLKGGDPFIYGRGGEECESLREAGINFQVVPGITAAAGCAAYAGIPLTHRDHAQTVQMVTGHCKRNGEEPDWPSLARARQTLVVYMGLINSNTLSRRLIEYGRSSETPVAIIENGTMPEQRVITGMLGELPTLISSFQVRSPALIIIGEVSALSHRIQWFKTDTSGTSSSSINQAPTG